MTLGAGIGLGLAVAAAALAAIPAVRYMRADREVLTLDDRARAQGAVLVSGPYSILVSGMVS